MNMRQSLLGAVALSLLAALAGPAASAQDNTLTMTSAPTTTGFTTTSAWAVAITGIVSGEPESVSFSGQAQIKSSLVRDPDFNRPSLLLTIDLSTVSGVGASTNATYVIPSQENVQGPLAPSHQVDITFPFLMSGSTDPASARSGLASFALDFDVSTGALTTATANVASPSF